MKKNFFLKIFVLIIAFILWLQQVMLKDHKHQMDIPLKFVDLPSDLIISDELPEVEISLLATGFEFLRLNLSNIFLEVDASQFEFGNNYFQISKKQIKYPKNIHLEFDILETNSNLSVFIDKTIKRYKSIKIQFESKEDREFFLKNKIINDKKTVEIEGPSRKMQQIDQIYTEKINKDMVNDGKLNVRLIAPDPQINLSSDKISYEIMQKRLVTKNISLIPIKFPEEKNITIIPPKISLMIKGPEDIVQKLNRNSIEANLDLTNIRNDFTTVNFQLPSGLELIEYTPKRIKVIQNQ